MDGARVYYVKRNKLVSERQIPYDFTHIVEFKKQNKERVGERVGERKPRNRLLTIEKKPRVDGGRTVSG